MPDSRSPAKRPSAHPTVVGIGASGGAKSGHEPRIAELEHELGAMRAELAEAACRSETSGDEQKAMNEELAAHNSRLQQALALLQGLLAEAVEGRAVTPPDGYAVPVIVIVDDDASIRTGQAADSGKLLAWRTDAARAVDGLTTRQREVMALVIAGHPSKTIAADLGISQRTVENHRAAIMGRTGCKSLPALARLALAAAWTGSDHSLVLAGPAGPGGR